MSHECRPELCGGTHYDPCLAPWGQLGVLLTELDRLTQAFESAVPTPMLRDLMHRHANNVPVTIGRVSWRDGAGRPISWDWIPPEDITFVYSEERR